MIKATFENILRQITEFIAESNDIIQISVSMFTSKDLLGQLEEKLRNDCSVEIIISDHVENNRLSFDRFISLGGRVYVISRRNGKFLHDKFAVFDNKKV
ncbi:MAG: phospholipase D-like domain-containing protein, partial [Bacteroidales bacterium]|nr:phospholipase D-like domain-containing protein [Bacteroidales bacterium]